MKEFIEKGRIKREKKKNVAEEEVVANLDQHSDLDPQQFNNRLYKALKN